VDESFTVPNVTQYNFDRFVREVDNWEVYYKQHCTKKDDSWATTVMLNNGVRIDKVSCLYDYYYSSRHDHLIFIYTLLDSKRRGIDPNSFRSDAAARVRQ
jgi:hypothetical protein